MRTLTAMLAALLLVGCGGDAAPPQEDPQDVQKSDYELDAEACAKSARETMEGKEDLGVELTLVEACMKTRGY